jgi:hypothetical protein
MTSLASSYYRATNSYSLAWNRGCAAKILQFLTARELRDEIYIHLIGSSPDVDNVRPEKTLPSNKANRYFLYLGGLGRRGSDRNLGLHNKTEHYFMARYMGAEFAVEIAQIFNIHAAYNVQHVYDVYGLLLRGPLEVHPSCRPIGFLRTLHVTVSMVPYYYTRGEDYWKEENEKKASKGEYEQYLYCLNLIATSKQVSRMKVTLSVEALYSSIIEKYKAVLLPTIQELVEKDCKMVVHYKYPRPRSHEEIIYDRSGLLSAQQLEELVTNAFVRYLETSFSNYILTFQGTEA